MFTAFEKSAKLSCLSESICGDPNSTWGGNEKPSSTSIMKGIQSKPDLTEQLGIVTNVGDMEGKRYSCLLNISVSYFSIDELLTLLKMLIKTIFFHRKLGNFITFLLNLEFC